MHRRRWEVYAASFGVVVLVLGGLFALAPKAQAGSAWGDSGATSGGGSGTGYYTSHGFGWELFDTSSGGPSGGFKTGNWGNISATCSGLGDNRVWVHVVRNTSGQEKSFTYQGASYNRDRPTSGLDPYDYNSSGAYIGKGPAAYNQSVINIVSVVHGHYLEANPSGSGWGVSVGWFCWSDNPPWTVSVSSQADKAYAEPGELITWTHKITNNGPSKTNKSITYQYQNTGNLPAGSGGNWTFGSGSGSGASSTQTSTYVVAASDFGKQICRLTSASPGANTGGTATSASSCVTIGKKPKVQIHGSDLILGRAFSNGGGSQLSSANTSISQLNPQGGANPPNNVFGSWVEYGIFATKTITGLGSGSAFAGGSKSSSTCSYSTLTFFNAATTSSSIPAPSCTASTSVGGYSTGRTIPDIAADFPVGTGTATYDDNIATPQGLYTSDASADPITVGAGGTKNIAKGEWVVINAPNADVTIANDIIYANPASNSSDAFHSIYDIPQMVIIAKNVYINPNVKEVDAWLIAQGSTVANTGILDTCHVSTDYTTKLTTNATQTGACDKVLQVNGPVMAQKLWLRRTGGATTNDPAEIFNLRPDAYLWAYARASTTGRVQTVYSQELPPRF
ncbi:hypothetical protein EPN95_04325 [Patescibacteria group bacterium]|nr:MAG: hypothetical protein EPN95_04325 [Patescibacteria group bacterium]